jgi:flagellar assembly protein FliH
MAADENEYVEEWPLPDFEDRSAKDKNETDLFGKPANWYNSKYQQNIEPEEEEPQPLTLEDIEAIRVSAYEDGFNEGKEAGFVKGLEEGKLQGLSEGHQEGLAQGLEQGLNEGQIKVDAQTLHWQQLVSRLHRPLEKLDDSVEYQLIKLTTHLAEQMVRCEVTVNPQVVLQALKQGVDALPANKQSIIISFHPEDLIFVQNAFPDSECKKRGWDLRAEPTLLRGDCHVQTNTSSIDYTFSSRIDQVLSHFLKENYKTIPDVNDVIDISNEEPLDYKMVTEQELQAQKELDNTDSQRETEEDSVSTEEIDQALDNNDSTVAK